MENWKALIENRELIVSVVGIGRIGLPTALMISNEGFKTYGIDIDERLVEKVNTGGGNPPIPYIIDEPELENLLKKAIINKKLKATTEFRDFASVSNFIIICIPTLITEQKVPDYSAINEVLNELGLLKKRLEGKIIIFESTVGPNYIEKVAIPFIEQVSELQINKDFWVASCPERANPGDIIKSLTTFTRIVGASNNDTRNIVSNFYETVFKVGIFKVSNIRTANSVKLIENIFRVVNIAFANEIGQLIRKLDIDYMEVLKGAATKYNFLPHFPGPGVGGPCLPSNPYYLIDDGYKVSFTPNLVRVATEVNQRQPFHIIELIFEGLNKINKTIANTKIAILGISYKANVKDIQISSVIPIISELQKNKAIIGVYDPYYKEEEALGFKIERNYEFIKQKYPMIIVHTDHNEFKSKAFKQFLGNCEDLKVIVD
ncbi:MAG: nucleotide sugar dehydrogenase, partial [Candidatus Lokiarchaeia archaeon]|nr:nucleotide sugar dehydrogenase [Candidatus Lokiarchaeia archaeon]